ncbi:hypothetical protein ACHAWO_003150 [Cyclotella atomus]|uniref:GST C-terminal domain-containing protein n=1 Tax=Cyclotella atomus TaxID=382360 RepID=A0ABD3MXN8_9STRA
MNLRIARASPIDFTNVHGSQYSLTVREAFVRKNLPRFMGYFEDLLKENGDFLTGADLTIADLSAFPVISYFGKGIADYIPKDCLDLFHGINAWMERVGSHPKVVTYRASKS